jgi:plasmid stabilization system protein ParE
VKVAITAAAEVDLEEIGDWIARDNPRRAIAFAAELRASCGGLADNPERFQVVARLSSHEVRRRVHGNYLIFYQVVSETVRVIRILRGARDYESLIFPDEEPG